MAELTEIKEKDYGIDNAERKYSFSEVKARCKKIAESLRESEGNEVYFKHCWPGVVGHILGGESCFQVVRKGRESNILGIRRREVLLEVRYNPSRDYEVYSFHEGVLPLVSSFF